MARPSKPWFRESKNTWYATVDGKMVSLGVQGRANAQAALDEWHRRMAMPKPKPKPPAEATVSEVIDAFLADCEGRVKGISIYRWFLDGFAGVHGTRHASTLTPTLAEAYSRKPTWCSSTRHDFLTALVTAFRWAERSRIIVRNPLIGIRKPAKASRGAKALLCPEQHEALMRSATPAFGLFLRVLHGTGARPGEVAAISAENFDADAGLVRLEEHKTSHLGKARTIYLTPDLVALLQQQREHYPTGVLLRTSKGKPWQHKTSIVRAMAEARRRAGVPHAIAYGYRHSFATDALANGVPDAQVAELLGHSGTSMLHRHYAHLSARHNVLRSALANVRQ